MMKIALPILLAGIVMIAGIYAFMPIDKATTVHTTIQGTQLNNVATAAQTDLSLNMTATCDGGTDFLVYYTFTNETNYGAGLGGTLVTQLGISKDASTSIDTAVIISVGGGNSTSVSGVVGGTASATVTFFGNGSMADVTDDSSQEDVGSLIVTVVCQSGSSPSVS